MKYRIVKTEFSDGKVWYKIQYKIWNWIPFWKNYRWHQDYGIATLVHALWFPTAEEALQNFKEHTCYFKNPDPYPISETIIEG